MQTRWLAWLALLALAVPACLANGEDIAADEAGISEQAMRERPPKPVLDCSKSDNEKCLECGYEGDDVEYCCRSDDDCDVINEPSPESEPIGGTVYGFRYDTTLTFVSW